MRIAVIGGAGGMGRVTTADAATSEGVERVILVDRDASSAAEVAAAYGNVEVREPGEGAAGVLAALAGADAVVNAATHRLNVSVMEACLEVGAHYTDLGGLYYYAIEQYELDAAFRRAGLSAAISMGAAPGITNMLAAAAVAELDTVESIEIIDGREQLMQAGGGARTYHLPEGDVECVYTIHSEPATLPRSYADRGIRSVEWRLGLPPAHTLPLRALVASGMASTDPVHVNGHDVIPRDVLVAVLARQGGAPEDPGALERLRAHVVGTRSGERVEIDADLPLTQCAEWGTDSGTYSTGVPPSIAAQLLASGQALRTGVGGPEVIVPVTPFFAALAARGMRAEIAVHQPLA